MNTREGQLILNLVTKRISQEEFLRNFRPSEKNHRKLTLDLLEEAYRDKKSDDVEFALMFGGVFSGFFSEHLDVLCRLSEADWHHSHEDIVTDLDRLRDKRAIDILYHAALKRHKYLDYDDARALAVKAIWALRNLNDPSADEKLKLLTTNEDEIVREKAAKRLLSRSNMGPMQNRSISLFFKQPIETQLIRALSMLGGVIALGFVLPIGEHGRRKFNEILFDVFMLFPVFTPYILSFLLSFKMPEGTTARKIFAGFVALAVVGGLLIYLDDLVIEPGAQSGFSFLVIPWYQLAVIGISYAFTFTISKKKL